MKKLLLSLLFAMLSFSAVEAQQFHSLNFLAPVTSLNINTNIGYTNLNSYLLLTGSTNINILNLVWTNLLGNQVTANGTNDSTQLTVDIPLWSDRNGNPVVIFPGPTNTTYSGFLSGMELFINGVSTSALATNTFTLTFVPLFDGVNQSTVSAQQWNVAVTGNGTTQINVATNMPMYLWPGAQKLRLQTITPTGATNGPFTFKSITVNGFVP